MPPVRRKSETYAITISTAQRHIHFGKTENAERLLQTILHYRSQGKFQLHAFAIMPDHVHLLITPAADQSTARCVQFIKGGYSFAARDNPLARGIWHTGYHDHRIRDLDDYANQIHYIANNPDAAKLKADFAFVHTHPRHLDAIDPCPTGLHG